MGRYSASRFSGGINTVFPDQIIIDGNSVIYRKGRVIGYWETRINLNSIASITLDTHIFFADVIIESYGGIKVRAQGFTRFDAEAIRQEILSQIP